MINIKHLLPSLREKKRYLTYSVDANEQPNQIDITNAIKQQLFTFLGQWGYGRSGILFVKTNKTKGVIRVARTAVDAVKTALITLRTINNIPVRIQTLTTSGILNKAKSHL